MLKLGLLLHSFHELLTIYDDHLFFIFLLSPFKKFSFCILDTQLTKKSHIFERIFEKLFPLIYYRYRISKSSYNPRYHSEEWNDEESCVWEWKKFSSSIHFFLYSYHVISFLMSFLSSHIESANKEHGLERSKDSQNYKKVPQFGRIFLFFLKRVLKSTLKLIA